MLYPLVYMCIHLYLHTCISTCIGLNQLKSICIHVYLLVYTYIHMYPLVFTWSLDYVFTCIHIKQKPPSTILAGLFDITCVETTGPSCSCPVSPYLGANWNPGNFLSRENCAEKYSEYQSDSLTFKLVNWRDELPKL